jgi:deoxyribonuclease V
LNEPITERLILLAHKHSTFHRWDLSPQSAMALQQQLAGQVLQKNQFGPVSTVAGVDVSYGDGTAKAAAVVLSYPDLEMIDCSVVRRSVEFPYVPGLLSFREGPVMFDALEKLKHKPDLLIFDGHGWAHPRRLGLASHLGVILDLPSIGCAKASLCGSYDEPGPLSGDFTFLNEQGEIIGAAVRSRSKVKPVFVSVGHRIDLATSITFVIACCRGYRVPETTRWAHRLASN